MPRKRVEGPKKPTGFAKGGANYKPPSGDGWGGPAKGAGVAFSPEIQPPIEAKLAGRVVAQTAREAAAPHAVAMVEVWRSIALDRGEPAAARVAAADKLVTRAEGAPIQTLLHVPGGDLIGDAEREAAKAALAARLKLEADHER